MIKIREIFTFNISFIDVINILTVGELPAHNHTASTSTTGNHTHNVTIFEYFEGGNGWGLGTYKNGKYWQGARFQDGCNVQKNTTNWVQQTGNHSPTELLMIQAQINHIIIFNHTVFVISGSVRLNLKNSFPNIARNIRL